MDQNELGASEGDLVAAVVAACQEAISRALSEPSEACGLARGLEGALKTLTLVQTEVGKGDGGIASVVDNADTLVRGALSETLRFARNPEPGLASLDKVASVAPPAVRSSPQEAKARLPTFGQVSQAYIDMRLGNSGSDREDPDIKYLRLRRQTFLDIVGDKPVDKYFPSNLQRYVSAMGVWPANVTKRASMAAKSTLEILADNQDRHMKPMTRKTRRDGYVANIKTMIRHGMADHKYRDPFAGAVIRYPATLAASVPREGLDRAVLGRIFAMGASSGRLDEAMLPLLSALTTRRLALLLHLTGETIRRKHGVWVAQVSDVLKIDGHYVSVPIKMDESKSYFVLHEFLQEIGFITRAGRSSLRRSARAWRSRKIRIEGDESAF